MVHEKKNSMIVNRTVYKLSMTTPDFPAWAPGFSSAFRRLGAMTQANLHQFEAIFDRWVPGHLLAQQDGGPHSRRRRWYLRLVFWTFLWQIAQAGASCREAIRQAQCLCRLRFHKVPAAATSPYCQARGQLPLECLEAVQRAVVHESEEALCRKDLWCGHHVRAIDGTTVTLEDTQPNQKAYPQQSAQKPGCGFPILRLVALFSVATGMMCGWATGTWHQHEMMLVSLLWEYLRAGEVLLGDRGFCSWGLLAQCQQRGIHAVLRARGRRRCDFRNGQRISPDERWVRWSKPRQPSASIPLEEWNALPQELTLRLVRCRLKVRGFRTTQILLVTTLLDSGKYPPLALGQLYLRRWDMELSLRHLKTTLQMEHLSTKTPATLMRELHMHLLVHNLVRRVMLQAARVHGVALSRISFAGTLASCRRFGEALLQARSRHQRHQLLLELWRVIAVDTVPWRPGRREPRALKRRPKPYPWLTAHRSVYREVPHKNRYWNGGPNRPPASKTMALN